MLIKVNTTDIKVRLEIAAHLNNLLLTANRICLQIEIEFFLNSTKTILPKEARTIRSRQLVGDSTKGPRNDRPDEEICVKIRSSWVGGNSSGQTDSSTGKLPPRCGERLFGDIQQ